MNRYFILIVLCLFAQQIQGQVKKTSHQDNASTITEQHEKMRLAYLGSYPNHGSMLPLEQSGIDLTWGDLSVSKTVPEKDILHAWHIFQDKEAHFFKLDAQRDEYLAKQNSAYRKYREMRKELAYFEKKYTKELAAAYNNPYLTEKIRKAQYEASNAYWNYTTKVQIFNLTHPEKPFLHTIKKEKTV